MKIAILIDEPRVSYLPGEEGLNEDLQKRKTVKNLKEVLSKRFECSLVKADSDIISKLQNENVSLVFNLCNGIRGETRQAQIPAILEFSGIPYTGSSILGHTLAINKNYACKVFKGSGVPTPEFISIYDKADLMQLRNKEIKFPVLVKPCDEGSGRGIHQDSLVYDFRSLKRKVQQELRLYNPPIMVTEYIKGREFTVGILGNGNNLKVLPILEISFEALPDDLAKFYSFEVKANYADKTIFRCPAPLDNKLKTKIENTAKKAYNALSLRDYARVDIRVKDDTPYVLEVNSLPGLQKGYSDITKMASACNLGYEGLILKIVENAINRYKQASEQKVV
ncbi:MAG: ATP-grasp domain-containing protein [Tepidanaerobacter acetatoxydans]|uniref:D-alanine--D-alanine ligase family protein n=1 Tax=Tepidanaerobacter acetatoxydans TaxID=499229 RepID=UPI0026EB65C5|nr:ATP-grasp domain-containing protein [Tepidanaerobacter acetatoxydans]NLU11262.1 ATP-grasp domain-containing protein [Tepidanaerobacter acetatoxydans]